MRLQGIVKWLESNVEEMRKSRQTTLSYLVSSVLSGAHAGVHALGRGLPGKTLDKHKIKHTYRFLRNEDVEVALVMKSLTQWAVGNRERVLVLLDWTDMGSYQQLVASVPMSGRSIPITCVTTFKKGALVRRGTEKELLLQVAAWVPEGVERVVIADLGFDGTA